ncbi:uncharacterized protein LY79DRAFT_33323 [Colletotrichum navitas]|uniref:Secreted protein n=1 Tax=Colletotrichum navitas TaxID=681940 RepID=A0AAD8Q859_9PEZI|nr:uncharacterized protein LY79DRAFT_33323 [Colletotrichum navitas]KAK1596847.1 hypothetical protein LY79DRAFT_33323 [Colletotrichum navitas]
MWPSIWVAFLVFFFLSADHIHSLTHTHPHTHNRGRTAHQFTRWCFLGQYTYPLEASLGVDGREGKPSRSARLIVHHQKPRPKQLRNPSFASRVRGENLAAAAASPRNHEATKPQRGPSWPTKGTPSSPRPKPQSSLLCTIGGERVLEDSETSGRTAV